MAWADGNESIQNTEDIIDSREVIARIETLEEMADADRNYWETDDSEAERDELDALTALAAEGATFEDWSYGVTLVRESHFKDYAMDFAEDIGAVSPNASWPNTCIDWDQAARELRMDYTSVDFDGITYYGR